MTFVGQEAATADAFSNTIGKSGSLRREAWKLLEKARDEQMPEDAHPGAEPLTVLKSVPAKVKDSTDGPACAEPAEEPFKAGPKRFDSLDSLYGWVNDFTQGKGTEGKELYRRCSGGCSPRYTFYIEPGERDSYLLRAEAICGQPRDREDNRYIVTAQNIWQC